MLDSTSMHAKVKIEPIEAKVEILLQIEALFIYIKYRNKTILIVFFRLFAISYSRSIDLQKIFTFSSIKFIKEYTTNYN